MIFNGKWVSIWIAISRDYRGETGNPLKPSAILVANLIKMKPASSATGVWRTAIIPSSI
jgi:hypothetical protein